MIHWAYRNYYSVGLGKESTFDQDVRRHVVEALAATEGAWKPQPRCFFFQAEDGIRDLTVTGVQTCALPIYFQVNRPIVSMAEGQTLNVEWPTTRFSVASPPGTDRDVLLIRGIEPSMRWRTF